VAEPKNKFLSFRSTGRLHHRFAISLIENRLQLRLDELEETFPAGGNSLFMAHLALKVLLNAHSTLVMGRLGRYESNVMTWVRPANNKLVDRAVRYATELLVQRGVQGVTYASVARVCFEEMERAEVTDAIVLRICDRFAGTRTE
jgi:N-acetylmuramic acid 6-phosphate etherase